jgi:transcriptional regulator GlxA family with amidase domain
VLGRSIHEEINRVRIEHAKRLLVETHLAMPDLAVRCGFNYATVFTKVYRQVTGTTPKRYRHGHSPS